MSVVESENQEVAAVKPMASSAITPMQMLQIAVEQNADLDKLQKLMDLHERWEANQARKAFVKALTAFKAEPPTVIKNRSASFTSQRTQGGTSFDYATLDQVSAVIGAALSKHDLTHTWEVQQGDGGDINVTCVLTHEQGHSERVTLRAGPDQSGSKNSIQAIGSTVTYLERYSLLAVTGLAARGQDEDAANVGGGETISAEQKDLLIALMKEVKADTVAFLKYMRVETLDELPASEFDSAARALELKRKTGGGGDGGA